MRERFGCCAGHGGEGWVLPREINWKHWHHCRYGCDLLPTMQQGPEWAYVGRSQGPHRVAQKHKTLKRGSLEGERKAAKRFGFSVFPICT